MTETQNLNELFALPINNKVVAKVDNTKLYSNDKLKEKFVEALSNVKETKKIAKKLEELISDGSVIPCWLNRGLTGFIAFKIFASPATKGMLGFFNPESDKFYILIDNNVILGFASNKLLSKLTLHESMHMFAHRRKTKFLRTFEKELESWYFHFLVSYLDLDIFSQDKREVKFSTIPIASFLFRQVELQANISSSVFRSYYNKVNELCKPYTKLDMNKYQQKLTDLMSFMRLYLKKPNSFMSSYPRYKEITKPMYEAYWHAFGISNLNTLCVQELMFPSEIICVMAESEQTSKVYQAFNSI